MTGAKSLNLKGGGTQERHPFLLSRAIFVFRLAGTKWSDPSVAIRMAGAPIAAFRCCSDVSVTRMSRVSWSIFGVSPI